MKTKIWLSLEPGRRQNPLNCQIICEYWQLGSGRSLALRENVVPLYLFSVFDHNCDQRQKISTVEPHFHEVPRNGHCQVANIHK